MGLTPEQISAVRSTLSKPATKVSTSTGISVGDALNFIQKVERYSIANHETLELSEVVFVFDQNGSSGKNFNDANIREFISTGSTIISVASDQTITEAMPGDTTHLFASKLSATLGCATILATSTKNYLYADGKILAEIDLGLKETHKGKLNTWSWREAGECFEAHFETCVVKEKQVRYWKNRRTRILLSNPDGTEMIFHRSLFWWCNNFLHDALSVFAEAQGLGQDKTDITIITEVGNIVVEVKWLGVNENGSSFAQIRINEGVIQVAEYLNNDPSLMKGYVVFYDGRSENDHKGQSTFLKKHLHEKCVEPTILFLPSETPSELATRVARKSR